MFVLLFRCFFRGVSVSISILRTAASSFLSKIFRQRCICLKLSPGLSINLSQNSSPLAIDIADSAKIDRQLPVAEGRTERMPGSIEFGCPGPDDPSLELQHDLVRFFVDCDSQHVMVCRNRGAKVRADTAEQAICNEIT